MRIALFATILIIFASFAYAGNKAVLTRDENGQVTQGILALSTVQKISTSGTSAATTNAFVRDIVRVSCTEDTYITFATTPTATSSHTFLPGRAIEYFSGSVGLKAAGIEVTAAGLCTFTEMK